MTAIEVRTCGVGQRRASSLHVFSSLVWGAARGELEGERRKNRTRGDGGGDEESRRRRGRRVTEEAGTKSHGGGGDEESRRRRGRRVTEEAWHDASGLQITDHAGHHVVGYARCRSESELPVSQRTLYLHHLVTATPQHTLALDSATPTIGVSSL